MDKLEANLLDAIFDLSTNLRRAVFLTYRFDPAFFAENVFPELHRQRCERALVLMDSIQYHGLPKSDLSAHSGRLALEHFPSNALFHPKLFVVTGGSRYRCIVGSANLTHDGFESNKEIFSVFSEQNGDTPGLIQVLSLIGERLRPDSQATKILRETVAELKAAALFQTSQSSTPLVWNGLGGLSLFQQLENELQGQKLKRAVVLSPYFEAPDHFDTGLLAQWLAKGIAVDLYVPFDQSHNRVPRDEIAKLRKKYPKTLSLFGVRTDGKILHAKLIGLMSASRAWLLAGSANFTYAALKGSNVETGLLFRMPRIDAERYLEHLLAKSRSIETHELPDPEVSTPLNTASQVSDYIVSAVLSVTQDCLTISLDRPWSQVGSPDKTIVELVGKSVQFEPSSESDNSIQIHHVGTYLKNADGNWEIGAVIVRTLDGSAYDWHLIELAPDEYLTDEGNEIDTAVDLETFVRQLLNPRLASPKRDKREFAEASHLSRLGHTDFEDAEGRLDRAYRLSCALDAHFAHLMTDPHTTYRWRGDWLRFYKLFANQTGDLGSEGRALIAVRLLSRVESCFASYPDELHQWLNGDPGMSESIKEFYRQSQMSPSFSAPTIATFVLQGDK